MEQDIAIRRLMDLSKKSYNNSCYTFSDFLSLAQISDFYSIVNESIFGGYTIFGGYEDAERAMIRFGSEEELGYVMDFPIEVLKVEPLIKKFSDKLTHRDYLGAIMNLGITREKLGDIVMDGNDAYVIVEEQLSDYIIDNLTKVKHTSIIVKKSTSDNIKKNIKMVEKNIIAASCRIDGVIAKMVNVSREGAIELFRSKKVFLNGRLCENNSYQLKEGDIVTVRGFGKFIFEHISGTTRSGRYNITISTFES